MWTFDNKLLNSTDQIPPKKMRVLSPEPIPKTYTKKKVVNQLFDKINDVVVFPGYKDSKTFKPCAKKPDIKYKWSNIEDKFR